MLWRPGPAVTAAAQVCTTRPVASMDPEGPSLPLCPSSGHGRRFGVVRANGEGPTGDGREAADGCCYVALVMVYLHVPSARVSS